MKLIRILKSWKKFTKRLVDIKKKITKLKLSMPTKNITDENFETEVLKADKPTLG